MAIGGEPPQIVFGAKPKMNVVGLSDITKQLKVQNRLLLLIARSLLQQSGAGHDYMDRTFDELDSAIGDL